MDTEWRFYLDRTDSKSTKFSLFLDTNVLLIVLHDKAHIISCFICK